MYLQAIKGIAIGRHCAKSPFSGGHLLTTPVDACALQLSLQTRGHLQLSFFHAGRCNEIIQPHVDRSAGKLVAFGEFIFIWGCDFALRLSM